MKFPTSSSELLQLLEQMFPERLPAPADTVADIQRYAGKREVVLFLKQLRDMTVQKVSLAANV